MIKMTGDCCEQCNFWDRTMDEEIDHKTQEVRKKPATSGMGACRKAPPHPYLMPGRAGPVVLAVWPSSPKTGWCGSFERNPHFEPVELPAAPPAEPSRLIV